MASDPFQCPYMTDALCVALLQPIGGMRGWLLLALSVQRWLLKMSPAPTPYESNPTVHKSSCCGLWQKGSGQKQALGGSLAMCRLPEWLLLLQAVTYFLRALKLNRNYLSAWTLMGHEYVEMKNIPAAIGKALRGCLLPLTRSTCGWEPAARQRFARACLPLPAHKLQAAATQRTAIGESPLLLSAGRTQLLQLSWQPRGLNGLHTLLSCQGFLSACLLQGTLEFGQETMNLGAIHLECQAL